MLFRSPLFPVEAKAYPASDVPGETAAATQVLPTKPAPFSRQSLTADMLSTRTPQVHQWAVEQFTKFRSEGQFVPFGTNREVVVFPGFDGGAEWGGSAFDPESGLIYINANEMPWLYGLAEVTPSSASINGKQLYTQNCAACHREDRAGSPPQFPSLVGIGGRMRDAEVRFMIFSGGGRMPSFATLSPDAIDAIVAYVARGEERVVTPESTKAPSPADLKYRFTGHHKFVDPDGYPAVQPPWGTLNAINLHTGEYAWKIPLGEYPELAEKGLKDTGTENYGGPIVTAGGLVFIAATNFDRKFRAFDKKTGKLLWETTLPMAGNATPVTYEAGGRQYVVIYATGGRKAGTPSGGVYVAFALP